MATLKFHLEALASAIGTDMKGIRTAIGALGDLGTMNKSDVVSALNELLVFLNSVETAIGGNTVVIGSAVGATEEKSITEALAKLLSDISAETNSRKNADDLLKESIRDLRSIIDSLANDVVIAGSSDIFIDELPEGDRPAISFVKVPETNTYKMFVRAPNELV